MKHTYSSVVLALMLGTSSVASAATLYVKTTGNDTKNCATWADACLTISRAATVAVAGDEINIAKGQYTFSSALSVSGKSLTFVGGFDDGAADATGDKYSTVITGDNDSNDTSKTTAGITPSYTNIVGANTAQAVSLGSGSYHFEHLSFTGFKGAQADAHGTVIMYANPAGTNNTLTLKDVAIIGNTNHSMGNVMVYATGGNKANVVMDDVWCENNRGDAGVCLTAHLDVTSVKVSNSTFKGNEAVVDTYGWNYGVGAIWSQGAALTINNSSFTNNIAERCGSAVRADGALDIANSTFADNTSNGDCDAGANIRSATINSAGVTSIRYSTIYSNHALAYSGGVQHSNATTGSLSLFGNLILANTINSGDNNIYAANASINDRGYNLIGYAGQPYVTGTFTKHATTQYPLQAEKELVVVKVVNGVDVPGAGYYGGWRDSVKLTKTSLARNLIPNDGIPFYGVGKSADYPFVTLQQAHGALKRDDYVAGIYHFDLGGEYDALNSYAFTPGDGSLQFTTYVDEDGYLLIASADSINETAAVYGQTATLAPRSDEILQQTVLVNANFVFDEVRISSYSGGDRGTFDGYSTSAAAVTAIKQFKSLPNPAMSAVWNVTHSSTGTNYFQGSAFTQTALNDQIYHASGASGIHWIPTRPNEALLYPGNPDSSTAPAFSDEMDLWVRSNTGVCDGSISSIDGRGLPRADKVPEDKMISDCDVGAFEFNDFYQIDCVDEDGMRPENTISKASVGFCFSDPSAITPRNILDNLGAISPLHLLMLLMLGAGLRNRRRLQN